VVGQTLAHYRITASRDRRPLDGRRARVDRLAPPSERAGTAAVQVVSVLLRIPRAIPADRGALGPD
jgi:hypothetical protein